MISPLWFYIMNPYVDEVIEGKKVSESHKKITLIVKHIAFFLTVAPVIVCFILGQ